MFAFLHVVAVVLGGIGGLFDLLVVAVSSVREFAVITVMTAVSLLCFFMSAVVWFGTSVVDAPFEIDAETGTTTDAQGRQWVRERHGPAKLTRNGYGPAAIIFPGFDMAEGKAPGAAHPRAARPTRRLLHRSFAWVFLGARGAEVDGLILPVGHLSDREAIMAAIKPERPRFRWW